MKKMMDQDMIKLLNECSSNITVSLDEDTGRASIELSNAWDIVDIYNALIILNTDLSILHQLKDEGVPEEKIKRLLDIIYQQPACVLIDKNEDKN